MPRVPFQAVGETVIKKTDGSGRGILCSSCGEKYDSEEKIQQLLINVAHCVNLTCLEDLSDLPLQEALHSYRAA